MKKRLKIVGLDCPVCASELEAELQNLDGVKSATLVFVQGRLTVEVDDEAALKRVIDTVNHFESARVVEETDGIAEEKKVRLLAWLRIGVSAVCLLAALLLGAFGKDTLTEILCYVCYALAYVAVAAPIWMVTVKQIAKGKIFDENFLMTLASIGAIFLREYAEAVAVILLYQIGEQLQSLAVGASKRSLTSLMELKSESATRLGENGEQTDVTPEALCVGDVVLVKKGERIPCDGVLLGESATLDMKSLTGESAYRFLKRGDAMLSGSINVGEPFTMRVVRDYQNSAVQKILDLVENSMEHKAPPEKFITRFAKIYTPIVCLLAICLAIVPPIVTGLVQTGGLVFADAQRWITSALTFLVVSCPCALVISVPLTYFSGIGACAKAGILVKGAIGLDLIKDIKTVAFDKTGTLTKGDFGVLAVYPIDVEADEVLAVAAALEQYSAHPIAGAFSHVAVTERAESVRECIGQGLIGTYRGETAVIGTYAFICEQGIEAEERIAADTVLYVGYAGKLLGCVEIGDAPREDCRTVLEQLKTLGIRSVMLTGDTPARAQNLANTIGISSFKAGLLPQEKVAEAKKLKESGRLLYVGDGVNDAPVMAEADCAVSMGGISSTAAVEASDFVLVADQLSALPKLIKTAKKTKAIVLQNVIFSIAMKVVFMVLGSLGVLQLWLAVFADVGVMLLAVLNSLRVSKTRKEENE